MVEKSMRDVAFELLNNKKKPVTFKKLWEEVSQILGFSVEVANEKIGSFYTQLSLDGRLVMLPENTWDLRSRHPFEQNVIYSGDDFEEEETLEETEDTIEESDEESLETESDSEFEIETEDLGEGEKDE